MGKFKEPIPSINEFELRWPLIVPVRNQQDATPDTAYNASRNYGAQFHYTSHDLRAVGILQSTQIAAAPSSSSWTVRCPPATATPAPPPSTPLVAPRPTRGEPPVCSKTTASGPPWANALTHSPMVWASRSKARPTAAAVQPCVSSHTACHRSRSRGVGARYIRRRTSASSMCHCSSNPPISVMPNCNPHSGLSADQLYRGTFYPARMRFLSWFT